MNNNALFPLEPVIKYPEQAQLGKTYLMTVDFVAPDIEIQWPYPEEEYSIFCLLNVHDLFDVQPIDKSVVIHKFGGTYGPARFLLTPRKLVKTGQITLNLINGFGVTMWVLDDLAVEIRDVVEDLGEARWVVEYEAIQAQVRDSEAVDDTVISNPEIADASVGIRAVEIRDDAVISNPEIADSSVDIMFPEYSSPLISDEEIFLVPPRNNYFTGRETLLQRLTEELKLQPVAVCGLGGMGKTQILTEYAHRQREQYSVVLWIEAGSADSLNNSWLKIAQTLSLATTESDDNTKLQTQVKQWLQTHSGWLLVLDNVEHLALVNSWIGELKDYGHILLSTRAANTLPLAEPLVVAKMSKAEGVTYLTLRTGLLADDSAANLVELLDGLPLALEQAAAYVLETGSHSYDRYMQLYQTHGLRLLERRGQLQHPADHPDPVAVTWLLNLEAANATPLASKILQYCAFLHRDGIIQEIFAGFDPFDYDEAMAVISQYSLLKRDDKAGVLFMHRLLQVIVRAQLAEDEQRDAIEQVVNLLIEACPSPENLDFSAWSVGSAEWLLNAKAIDEWIMQFKMRSAAIGNLFNQMAYCLKEAMGDDAQALSLHQKALEIREEVLGKHHPDYAQSLNNVGFLCLSLGQNVQAFPLFREALTIREQVLGKQHPDYAQSLNSLAMLHHSQGELTQALPLYRQALAILTQALGTRHPHTQNVQKNHKMCLQKKVLPLENLIG